MKDAKRGKQSEESVRVWKLAEFHVKAAQIVGAEADLLCGIIDEGHDEKIVLMGGEIARAGTRSGARAGLCACALA